MGKWYIEKMNEPITQKLMKKYKTVINEEQTKDLISLVIEGYTLDEACDVISTAGLFNSHIDVA